MLDTSVLLYFGRPRLGHDIKTNFITFRTVDLEICSIFSRFWDKLLHHTLCMLFQEKYFLCYTPKFNAWLPLLHEILDNICIAIIYCPVFDVIYFEINHSFHIKPFLNINKISGQKCKYLKNEKSV